MAQVVGKYAANKLLSSQMKKYQSKRVEGGDVSFLTAVLGDLNADISRIHTSL